MRSEWPIIYRGIWIFGRESGSDLCTVQSGGCDIGADAAAFRAAESPDHNTQALIDRVLQMDEMQFTKAAGYLHEDGKE